MGNSESTSTDPFPFTALHDQLPFIRSFQSTSPDDPRPVITDLITLLTLIPLCDNTLFNHFDYSANSSFLKIDTALSKFLQEWALSDTDDCDVRSLVQQLHQRCDDAELHSAIALLKLCLPPPRATTADDQLRTYFLLRRKLPAELALAVIDLAEYYVTSIVVRFDKVTVSYENASVAYLQTPRLEGRILKVVFTVASHDQGWSSYPEDQGTYRGSWTWFSAVMKCDLWHHDSEGGEMEKEVELCRNLHAVKQAQVQEVVVEGRELTGEDGGRGESVQFRAHARYPGWQNTVLGMRVVVFSSAL